MANTQQRRQGEHHLGGGVEALHLPVEERRVVLEFLQQLIKSRFRRLLVGKLREVPTDLHEVLELLLALEGHLGGVGEHVGVEVLQNLVDVLNRPLVGLSPLGADPHPLVHVLQAIGVEREGNTVDRLLVGSSLLCIGDHERVDDVSR